MVPKAAPTALGATRATTTATYAATGVYSSSCSEGHCLGDPTYTYAGQLSCVAVCSSTTQAGSVSLSLVIQKLIPVELVLPQDPVIPVDPIFPQKARGTFTVTWADLTTTSGTLSGHSIPPKGMALNRDVTATTNVFIPQDPKKGFVTLSEARVGSFTGSFALPTTSG